MRNGRNGTSLARWLPAARTASAWVPNLVEVSMRLAVDASDGLLAFAGCEKTQSGVLMAIVRRNVAM